jgi:hypothetical protein
MRIWSIHPKYLDTKGLVALWRETLLAKCVLEGKTKGYRNHPQLNRFKQTDQPINAIHHYLAAVYDEAFARGYHFDRNKINWEFVPFKMVVTTGQIKYEAEHLLNKLKKRDAVKFKELHKLCHPEPHPMFEIVDGGIEKWEII